MHFMDNLGGRLGSFDRLEKERFDSRLTSYVEKHTGVRMKALDPRPPKDG